MAEVRRGRVKRKQLKDELEKPTKEEYAVAKYLRFNAPSKEGKFLGNNANYFTGSKAVDALLESPWASTKNTKSNPLFPNRAACMYYCERLLEKGFFQRAARPEKRDKKKRLKDGAKESEKTKDAGVGGDGKRRKEGGKEGVEKPKEGDKSSVKDEYSAVAAISKKASDKKNRKEESPKSGENEGGSEKSLVVRDKNETVKQGDKEKLNKDDTAEEKKRRKKKLKLEPHEQQMFIDGAELYVWLYDPVQAKTFIIGLFLVLGAIVVCLFPLWPPEVRLGVYYLSLVAAGFVGLILSLCIVRMVIFSVVWVLTFGKVTFWLLPNLTEDVGFLDSFRPFYNCEYSSKKEDTIEDSKDEGGTGKDDGGNRDEAEKDKEASGAVPPTVEDAEPDVEFEEQHPDDVDVENEEVDDDDEGRHSGSSNSYEIVDPDDVDDLNEEPGEDEDQSAEGRSTEERDESKKDK